MAILKAERKTCNDVQPLLSLHLINALIRSVKKTVFRQNRFRRNPPSQISSEGSQPERTFG